MAPAVWQAADGYLTAHVDAAQTKVHMIHHLFHAVAQQVDWDGMAERWLRTTLPACGILVEPEQPFSAWKPSPAPMGATVPQLYAISIAWSRTASCAITAWKGISHRDGDALPMAHQSAKCFLQ